jgi:hypothetical protein
LNSFSENRKYGLSGDFISLSSSYGNFSAPDKYKTSLTNDDKPKLDLVELERSMKKRKRKERNSLNELKALDQTMTIQHHTSNNHSMISSSSNRNQEVQDTDDEITSSNDISFLLDTTGCSRTKHGINETLTPSNLSEEMKKPKVNLQFVSRMTKSIVSNNNRIIKEQSRNKDMNLVQPQSEVSLSSIQQLFRKR